MCSAFRTFQGWTALSDMARDQGVLHTVPIPGAMAYLMLRPLLPTCRTTTCAVSDQPDLPRQPPVANGSSPGDFPDKHYERTWANRFTEAELNTTGRRGLNLS